MIRFARGNHAHFVLIAVLTLIAKVFPTVASFSTYTPFITFPKKQTIYAPDVQLKEARRTKINLVANVDNLSSVEYDLAFWTFSFASTHIGLSAVRDKIINKFGRLAADVDLIDRGISLPDFWPGDDKGNQFFPDEETTGRQLYRLFYTIISFVTLGAAFATYINGHDVNDAVNPLSQSQINLCLSAASLSFAASIASLFNASPLSLMPGFQPSSNAKIIERVDSLKLVPKGLTRITRHPLILPVVPWAIASSFLQGAHVIDFIFFDGLALYAVAGCYAQDLRVSKQEGSVGTTFFESTTSQTFSKRQTELDLFFQSTSFVPFGAIIDGRQRWSDLVQEFPLVPFLFGIPVGYAIECQFLQFLNS